MTRRDFTKLILAGGVVGWLGSVIYPVLSYLRPPKVPEAVITGFVNSREPIATFKSGFFTAMPPHPY